MKSLRFNHLGVFVASLVFVFGIQCRAETTPEWNVSGITEALLAPDKTARDTAIEHIAELMQTHPERAAGFLASRWLKPLLHDRRYQELSEWCLKATCVQGNPPLSMAQMEFLQEARVKALLGLRKNAEALSAAKSLYNFCRMQQTSRAIQLVSKCLAADPKTASLRKKFQNEQIKGQEAPSTQPSAALVSSVLKSIQVDAKPYETPIALQTGKDFHSLLRQGNLLLLADKPDRAQKTFELACKLAKPEQLPGAIESVARAIRAEDGTIGRANAYLLAHDPRVAAGQIGDVPTVRR